ncbi:putative quinol monooxygenase [Cochleicola gelatinilyticus]|uniref:Antibiotic biosynthesis monooxygenase n=1 Tax=Cochleicola gelatinilyticus TaxID=1763537 RepID=A0A167G7S5_9FLAO|nr:antibiotic biosynthesis monooxygenase family protein [Cochleicola gelatinilyticus]OAB77306.1 antibiotic biosynthesis monooxygenase [Cochleicola gelatinilyticus]
MFTRIVKMEFDEIKIPEFLANFETVKQKIRNYPGCLFLELYHDKNNPTIFFTYSRWKEEQDLENYRHSELFKGVWAKTKPMFKEKAQAWSVDTLASLV